MNDTEIVNEILEILAASETGRFDAESDAAALYDIIGLLRFEGRFDQQR